MKTPLPYTSLTYALGSDITGMAFAIFGEMADHVVNYKYNNNSFIATEVSDAITKDTGVKPERVIKSKITFTENEENVEDEYASSDDVDKEYGMGDDSATGTIYNFFKKEKVLLIEYHSKRKGVDPMLLYFNDSDKKFMKVVKSNLEKFGYLAAKNMKQRKTVYMLAQNGGRTSLEEISVDALKIPKKTITHYNDDFIDFSHHLEKTLAHNNKSGLVILHGPPGCGKTTYIRYLLGAVNNKKMIYIPPSMASSIAHPNMISTFLEYKNAVLIIEDAEEVLRSREAENGNSQAVSNLLNMTDGILSDALNMQIICTFNTDIAFIDQALRRRGRLIGEYKFGPLKNDKAKILVEELYGKNAWKNMDHSKSQYVSGMTLAEIYSLDDPNFTINKEKTPFGFNTI